MTAVQANGITIEYEERGEGTPLLMVMGLGGQLIDWPPQLLDDLAARGFRVITFDNRDGGLSSEMAGPPPSNLDLLKGTLSRRWIDSCYLLSDMAADAVGLLDALGIEHAHVAGISMGGMIGQTMAFEHRSRVRSLASIMSTTGNPRVGRPTLKIVYRTVRRPIPTADTAIDSAVETFRALSGPHFDEERFREMARASVSRSFRPAGTARQLAAVIASGDRTEQLERLEVPTVVVHGMLDPLVKPSGGIATAKAIRGSRLIMFNDMAHDLPAPRLSEIADAIARNAERD